MIYPQWVYPVARGFTCKQKGSETGYKINVYIFWGVGYIETCVAIRYHLKWVSCLLLANRKKGRKEFQWEACFKWHLMAPHISIYPSPSPSFCMNKVLLTALAILHLFRSQLHWNMWRHQMSFEICFMPPIGTLSFLFFCFPTRGMKLISNDIWWRHTFQCN